MDLQFGFCWVGLLVFALPMLPNLVYVFLPPMDAQAEQRKYPAWELVENGSRIAYLLLLSLLVSRRSIQMSSPLFFLAVVFLLLYTALWVRYFRCGHKSSLLGKAFLFIPQPMAVFPVLYFFFAALWLHNLPAAGMMVLFGIAHNAVTYRNLRIHQ